jgi:DNA polymerase-1
VARRAVVIHAPSLLRKALATSSGGRWDPSGRPTDALFAIAAALDRVWAFKQPDVAVALLDDAPSGEQAARLPELLAALGVPWRTAPDPARAAATLTRAATDDGYDVVVVGSDKRLAQLVGPGSWWYDAYKDLRYTPELVTKRFGVGPSQVADVLGLAGDDDTLPGLTGVGNKGAADLVRAFGSAAEALERLSEVGGRVGNALRADPAAARAELERAHLRSSDPPVVAWRDVPWAPPDLAARDAALRAFGFHELLVDHADGDASSAVVWGPGDAAAGLARWSDRVVAVFPLYDGPSPPRGALVGLGLSDGASSAYVPVTSTAGLDACRAWLERADAPKVTHSEDAASLLLRVGVTLRGGVGDTEHASHALEPSNHAPHELPGVARVRLGRALPEEAAVRGVGKGQRLWGDVPAPAAAAFAGAHADAMWALWAQLGPQVPPDVAAEQATLAEVLVRMSRFGVAVDVADLAGAGADFAAIAATLDAQIAALAGGPFNWGSTKQLGAVLFEQLGLPVVSRTKTGPSTATEALERIEHAHPIVALVLRARQLQRLQDVWVTALAAAVDPDGRVRSTFHHARSFSGRLINSSPDLGRVPGKTAEMARIRHAFRAPPGRVLGSLDYAQLGLYVLAHQTGDPELVGPLSEGADLHARTAAAVLSRPLGALTVDERQVGKLVNFATFAGQGASALALQLGVGAAEARDLISKFDQHYSVTRAWQEAQLESARRDGFVTTIAGRRWPVGGLDAQDGMIRAAAERLARRAAHDGSVADVSRRGLWRADHALRAAGLAAAPVMVVHDEVLFEVPTDEVAAWSEVAGEAMRTAFALRVPLKVGCEVGPSWSELEATWTP